ncbi:hypothetical protein JOC86_002338 [Bacillus pakistanensis]|uniref:Uncharacterized protein n=1 Tax=Rossellomorea pakistanensis TaxID=992288 RepID=A0ABS2ND55_9BACI|nr:hypothetical protein [Bacillus pakistanensis]MBM7585796.1 hypothetical protein [Bacillus pakistanensis]
MIHHKVYSHYHHDGTLPIWFVIDVKRSTIDWNENILHVPIQQPFDEHNAEEFDQFDMNLSINMGDLTLGTESNSFGINLCRIKKRLEKYDAKSNEISNFVLLTQDIAEILNMTV